MFINDVTLFFEKKKINIPLPIRHVKMTKNKEIST